MNNDFTETIRIKKKLIKAIAETFFKMDCFFLGQNICRLHFFAQFSFTTSETELDYYHQKVNVRIFEQLKT